MEKKYLVRKTAVKMIISLVLMIAVGLTDLNYLPFQKVSCKAVTWKTES